MRKTVVFLMVLCMALAGAVAFAGSVQESESDLAPMTGADPTSFAKFAVEEGASIVFSGWGDQTEQQIYRDSIARFNLIYPDVDVDFQPIPAEFQTKLKAMMAGGTEPDVFYVDADLMTAFGSAGQLMALDDMMDEADVSRSDFIDALLTMFTLEGDTYALPKDWGTLGLTYLPAAFEEAGIAEPTDSWTWDDVYEAAKIIADRTDYAGFGQNADWARFAPWAFAVGGTYTNSDYSKATLDTAEIREAASFLLDMKDEGILVTSADVGAGWCGEALGKELIAMTYEGGWMVNYLKNDFADVVWKAVPIPTSNDGVQSNIIFTNGLGVSAHTEYPRAAAAFAIFVTSRENQAKIVETGFAYSTHPDQVGLVTDPNDRAIAAGGLTGEVAYWGPYSGKIQNEVSQALERIYLGVQTIEESFAEADENVNAILAGE